MTNDRGNEMSYTPTTEEVRRLYVRHCSLRGRTKYPPLEELEDEFDRWLAALIREAKAEAWDAGARAVTVEYRNDPLVSNATMRGIQVRTKIPVNQYREGSET